MNRQPARTFDNTSQFAIVPLLAILFGFVLFASTSLAQPLRCDPTKIVTSEACSRCHGPAISTWKQTPHFQTFDSLHRNPRAKEICNNLGLKGSIKRNDVCVDCHYTTRKVGDKIRTVAGGSCESCHNAAQDWILVHSDYGGTTAKKEDESPEHRATRLAESIKLGMRNPRNIYSLARSCLNCHTVPNEKLVNVGGHHLASDFELVSWSQGTVRHNFVRSNGTENATNSQETLRVMYIAGMIADLEFSTRATAQATSKTKFGLASAQRAARVAQRLFDIQQKIQDPQVQSALEAFAKAELKINNAEQLSSIADEIRHFGFEFASKSNGSSLTFVDALIPPPSQYK